MNVLGIHYGHNCTVGLSIDGKVVSMLSEERLCRLKNATGFPYQAIKTVVDAYLDGDMSAIDQVAVVDGSGKGAAYLLRHGIEPQRYLDYYWKHKDELWARITSPSTMATIKGTIRSALSPIIGTKKEDDARKELFNRLTIELNNVKFYDHHACHASSAAYFSPLKDGEEWLVLTLDGEGDSLSSTVSVFCNGTFKKISSNSNLVSLGYLYAETTAYLGMKPNEHEFKLMGMAPYADPEQVNRLAKQLSAVIRLQGDGTFVSERPTTDLVPLLAKMFAFERFDVISGAVQKVTEELVCQWAEHWVRATGISRVAVAGGVFMNVKAVKQLAEQNFVDDFFVVPSSSDESLPLGAMWYANREAGIEPLPIRDLYLGRSFDEAYIERMIQRDALESDFEIERFDSIDAAGARVAALLAEDEIVARCCGREEWGARALGNRSILCNPSSFQNIERLNSKIKSRDFWMPFTPSLLAEEFPRYVINPKNIFAPYMAITFDTASLARKHFAAAVHPRDFTMRPQAVLEEWNPGYYSLIRQFRDRTGIGGVLNTSFNLHGEPNVSTPEDAIRTVRNSGLDYVLIENVLFHKKQNCE